MTNTNQTPTDTNAIVLNDDDIALLENEIYPAIQYLLSAPEEKSEAEELRRDKSLTTLIVNSNLSVLYLSRLSEYERENCRAGYLLAAESYDKLAGLILDMANSIYSS